MLKPFTTHRRFDAWLELSVADYIQSDRMIGIQKEKLVSLNLLTVQKSGLHHYKGKQSEFFFYATLS
jgi:hypothetical protein